MKSYKRILACVNPNCTPHVGASEESLQQVGEDFCREIRELLHKYNSRNSARGDDQHLRDIARGADLFRTQQVHAPILLLLNSLHCAQFASFLVIFTT